MKQFAYVGCRTTKERKARGKGIRIFEIENGTWKPVGLLEGPVNPSYFCLNEAQDMLYTIHGDYSEVSAYRIQPDGNIVYCNTVGTHGTNPVHLVLDRSGKWLYVANLQTGAVSLIPVLEDGSLGKIKELYFISGNGGPGYISHPHQTMLDRSGRWLAVPSQGRLQGVGKITLFETNGTEGTLREHFAIKGRTGAEPRHCVFAPSNRFCYCVNEKDSTVAAYRFDENEGTLEPMQILTSLPEDYAGDGWASAIDMDAEGKTLYVSNRKHDSVSVYHLDAETGRMSWMQNVKTGGEQPRFLTVSPDGAWVVAANEVTDTIACFKRNEDGSLQENPVMVATESPVCVVFKTR